MFGWTGFAADVFNLVVILAGFGFLIRDMRKITVRQRIRLTRQHGVGEG